MAVYLGSDIKLKTSEWDKNNPAFFVTQIKESNKEDALISKMLGKKYVYYLGAYEGCSCGFSVGKYGNNEEKDDDYKNRKTSVNQLKTYLINVLKADCELLLYSCWEGDQYQPIKSRKKLNPNEIDINHFWFKELELLTIVS